LGRAAAVESMNDGVLTLNARRQIVDCNPAASRIIGVDTSGLSGQTPEAAFAEHRELLAAYRDLVTLECEDTHPVAQNEATIVVGSIVTVIELQINCLTDRRDRMIGYLMVLRDITARKQAQDAARRRLGELSALRKIDEHLTSSLDVNWVLQTALTAAAEISGADAGFISLLEGQRQRIIQVHGEYPTEAFPLVSESDEGPVGHVIRDPKPLLVTDFGGDTIRQRPATRAQMVIPLTSRSRLIGVLNLETDRSDVFDDRTFESVQLMAGRISAAAENARLYGLSQMQLEEMKTLYDQVSQLEQLKTDMIRLASHDLRNPLSTIIGFLDLLHMDRKNLQPRQLEAVTMSMELAEQMQNIIKDILSLERYQQDTTYKMLDIYTVVQQVTEQLAPQASAKRLTIESNLGERPMVVIGDTTQLREAVRNLVTNAVKYTREGGHVTVSLDNNTQEVCFQVEDNGIGIPKDLQDRLFEPFYRAPNEETRGTQGTGLGLYLVKSVIERHNGQVFFHSEHGKGSTFGFSLPLKR
jgi:PAS domain S-box-containing protein